MATRHSDFAHLKDKYHRAHLQTVCRSLLEPQPYGYFVRVESRDGQQRLELCTRDCWNYYSYVTTGTDVTPCVKALAWELFGVTEDEVDTLLAREHFGPDWSHTYEAMQVMYASGYPEPKMTARHQDFNHLQDPYNRARLQATCRPLLEKNDVEIRFYPSGSDFLLELSTIGSLTSGYLHVTNDADKLTCIKACAWELFGVLEEEVDALLLIFDPHDPVLYETLRQLYLDGTPEAIALSLPDDVDTGL